MRILPIVRFLTVAVLLLTACSRPKPIAVGSKDSVEQQLLAEITAQHLERRLSAPVERRLQMGDTRTIHQSMLNGEIAMYPEYSGLIVSELLREIPSPEPGVVYERARQEMKRAELLEYLAPLGFDSPTALVVRAAGNEAITSATQAAASPTRWKVGISYEFQNRASGLPSLNTYRLDMGAPLRSMKEEELFTAMEQNLVNMITTTLSNPRLLSADWKVLQDDQHTFPPGQAALLVRDDVLAAQPELRRALAELSGKIDLAAMRRLNAEVAVKERKLAEVAAEFLKSAGLN